MSSVVVGYEGSPQSKDALALGATLALALEAALVVTCVHPMKPRTARIGDAGFDRETRAGAQRTAESARELLARPDEAECVPTLGLSAAAGLIELAEQREAAAIVIGSSHRSAIGRLLLGSVARELLRNAPCTVAIAPAGYAQGAAPLARGARIGAAFDDSPASLHAVHLAEALAARIEGRLRVIAVVPPDADGHPLRDALAEVTEAAPANAHAAGVVVEGDPVQELALASDDLDALVCGTRGLGPVRRTALGSVSTGLLERARCPLLVRPPA